MRNLSNEEYVDSLNIKEPELRKTVLDTLAKYGDDKWWLSEDRKVLMSRQCKEEVMVIPYDIFLDNIGFVLVTPTFGHHKAEKILPVRDNSNDYDYSKIQK